MTVPTVEVFELVMADGSRRIGGKIVNLNGVLVFYRHFEGAELRKWRAFSMDDRLIPLLVQRGVRIIDEVQGGIVYRIPLERFLAIGTSATHSHNEGAQTYVAVDSWHRAGAPYKTIYKRETTLVPYERPTSGPPSWWKPAEVPQAKPRSPQGSFEI